LSSASACSFFSILVSVWRRMRFERSWIVLAHQELYVLALEPLGDGAPVAHASQFGDLLLGRALRVGRGDLML
jgi:hypothetical protein